MLGLITDRGQNNVDRLNELNAKGWNNMTDAERAEWSGDPLLADGGANLLPKGENFSISTAVKYRENTITVTSNWDGTYIYAVLFVGAATSFEGKVMTLSLDSIYSSGGQPNIVLYWHDANGAEYAGGGLSAAGSMSFTLTENTAGRANLALYLYATTDAAITAGDFVQYTGLMLESGSTRHPYVPHYGVLPTPATKGAYNFSDLNRVEWAVAELADMINLPLVTKTDWTAWDVPTQSDMERYLNNIAAIRAKLYDLPNIPDTPTSMAKLTYTTANNIEKILEALETVISASYRSGELYSGEV